MSIYKDNVTGTVSYTHLDVYKRQSQKREISSVVAQLGEEVSVKKQELKNATTEKELAEEATQKANEERITRCV